MARTKFRTQASARAILRKRWKTALKRRHIPTGTAFRFVEHDLMVDPRRTTRTKALFLADADGANFPGLSGGVPFTPPKRKPRKRRDTERHPARIFVSDNAGTTGFGGPPPTPAPEGAGFTDGAANPLVRAVTPPPVPATPNLTEGDD